jgi:hypothetical protein
MRILPEFQQKLKKNKVIIFITTSLAGNDLINDLVIVKIVKGIVSKLTVKFWMCQKCGKMEDYNEKMTTDTVE